MKNRAILIAAALLFALHSTAAKQYNSYKGLVMAGYQGWFNAPDDGADRGWHHYVGRNGFKPGSTNIDLWPDVTDYPLIYKTPFKYDDGTAAYTFSSYDSSTVFTHFKWMKEYGIDGVFMQRFLSEISNKSGMNHFNHVLQSAMAAANQYERAICVMYDLSGVRSNQCKLIIKDIQSIAKKYSLFDHAKNPSYLYHNGKPLVSVWGAGFNDGRKYNTQDVINIVDNLKSLGFSVMIGVPTYWREFGSDTEKDILLHKLINKSDILMPWFVGRYNADTYRNFIPDIKSDMQWASKNSVDYAPLCYAGFSWKNMHGGDDATFSVARDGGRFFWQQLQTVIGLGAQMIYVAMFDEIDEGTAIFKISSRVPSPVKGSTFVPLEAGVPNDQYLWLAGEAAKTLRKEIPLQKEMPQREKY